MKPIKNLAQIFLILIIPSFLISCNNLSRDKAEKIIKEKLQLPKNDIGEFTIEDDNEFFFRQTTLPLYQKLQDAGVLNYSIINGTRSFFSASVDYEAGVVANLTEKGKQYVASEIYSDNSIAKKIKVITSRSEFGEVTGITEDKMTGLSTVEYTILVKDVTPFGAILFNISEGNVNKRAYFKKYDDGWRIQNGNGQ